MNMKLAQKIVISLMLGLLVASAFFIRLHNFKKSSQTLLTIDEMVYYRMAEQVKANIGDYNTIPYGKELQAKGRDLQPYFFAPLFKHPPVFTYLVAFSMKIFGESLASASYVSLGLGALMIPLIYLIGATVFNRIVGLIAAILLWLDPVTIICSQKIWMDIPIAFFTLISALFFVLALKKDQDIFFILSGTASGLALNTKYSGLLITFAFIAFALFYRRDLFLRIKFNFSLVLPFILFLPWLYWNYHVYGLGAIKEQEEIVKLIKIIPLGLITILGIISTLLIGSFLIKTRKHYSPLFLKKKEKKDAQREEKEFSNVALRYVSFVVATGFVIYFLKDSILCTFDSNFLPKTTWRQGVFLGETPSFYFRRLVEFFGIYILSFVSFLIYKPKEKPEASFIRITAIIILLFFILWGNFQSRYILSTIPFFLLMASDLIFKIFKYIQSLENFFSRLILKFLFVLFLGMCLMKVHHLNVLLSYTNDMCFF